MSEAKKIEAVADLKNALADIPEQYRGEVCRSLTHDIGVMAKAISIAKNQPG